VNLGGASLADAVDMAGARPRELLGLPARRLAVGEPAELVLFDFEPGGEVRVRADLWPA
jgi:N-acetylglucosamine-6-phosphate deacetylase